MLYKIQFKIIAISRKHVLGKYKPRPCDGISYKLKMNWTSKQNVSSAALQIKTSEITMHLWSHYFLHFETAIVSREMKRKWRGNGFILHTCLWIFLGSSDAFSSLTIAQRAFWLKKKKSQDKSRIFQYKSVELRNHMLHLFFEHKNSGALLSKAEWHLLCWICDPWHFPASFLTPHSFRFPEVNAGVIFREWL